MSSQEAPKIMTEESKDYPIQGGIKYVTSVILSVLIIC